jgi:AbrB family looped-hinge helix DNA binding protein
MPKTKLSSKGQIVVPKDIRDRLGWTAGDTLTVDEIDGEVRIATASAKKGFFKKRPLDEVIGCAGYKGPPIPVERMNDGIAVMFAKKKKPYI